MNDVHRVTTLIQIGGWVAAAGESSLRAWSNLQLKPLAMNDVSDQVRSHGAKSLQSYRGLLVHTIAMKGEDAGGHGQVVWVETACTLLITMGHDKELIHMLKIVGQRRGFPVGWFFGATRDVMGLIRRSDVDIALSNGLHASCNQALTGTPIPWDDDLGRTDLAIAAGEVLRDVMMRGSSKAKGTMSQ